MSVIFSYLLFFSGNILKLGTHKPSSEKSDKYHREGVPSAVGIQFSKLLDMANPSLSKETKKSMLDDVKVFGISKIYQYIQDLCKQSTDATWTKNFNHFAYGLEKQYDHLDKRIGEEVIFSDNELKCSAYLYTQVSPRKEQQQKDEDIEKQSNRSSLVTTVKIIGAGSIIGGGSAVLGLEPGGAFDSNPSTNNPSSMPETPIIQEEQSSQDSELNPPLLIIQE